MPHLCPVLTNSEMFSLPGQRPTTKLTVDATRSMPGLLAVESSSCVSISELQKQSCDMCRNTQVSGRIPSAPPNLCSWWPQAAVLPPYTPQIHQHEFLACKKRSPDGAAGPLCVKGALPLHP